MNVLRIVLVLLAVALFLPSVTASPGWSQPDPSNDVSWTVAYGTADSPPAPASPATLAYVDLLSLDIVDSDTSVTFVLANQAGFVAQATDPSPADRYLSHVIRFKLAGNEPVASVYLESSMPPGTPDEIHPTSAEFCFLENDADGMCYQGGERLSFATGGGKATITLPKDLLDNLSPCPKARPSTTSKRSASTT